ncbi:MAG: Ni/Fe hydrogenase subunit alpha [Candidatus Hydrogenedentes bacterium]|nr:Ni/Fe hydrogenase subunit alpha [Candidatus Hydrogenedentota bacterium]
MSTRKSRTLKVDYLARVEGEGALFIRLKDDNVTEVQLRIFEPPRFFEGFLRGRRWTEAPDITARICGICPIAYLASSISAMESIVGAEVPHPIRELRRLIYCGEWIESHILHLAMLHAPDFLGYQDALAMAKDHPDIVKGALRLKKIGNDIMVLLGGREIHPINLRVGGFYSVPTKDELQKLRPDLEWGLEASQQVARWAATLDYPDFERDYEFVALRHPKEYPLWEGRLVSNKGLDIPLSEFYDHVVEEHVARSTSLHSSMRQRGTYHVGPLARYALNYEHLTPGCQALARECGLGPTCNNPFKSLLVRAIETVYAYEEALRIVNTYEMPDRPYVPLEPRAGRGYGCSEAPRGICYHTYAIDDQGVILDARIAPPTAQNQRCMEEDLAALVPQFAHLKDDDLTWRCEQAVRNYDPCISCSCHFLKLEVQREYSH